jgi:hypothetical protein
MSKMNPVVKKGRQKKILSTKEIEISRLRALLASGIIGDEYKKVSKQLINLRFGKDDK